MSPILFNISVLLDVICQKPAHFLSAQMALVSTFFQMFIVLGVYNFAFIIHLGLPFSTEIPLYAYLFLTFVRLLGTLSIQGTIE